MAHNCLSTPKYCIELETGFCLTIVGVVFPGTKFGHSPSHHPKMFAVLCADLNDLHDAVKGMSILDLNHNETY